MLAKGNSTLTKVERRQVKRFHEQTKHELEVARLEKQEKSAVEGNMDSAFQLLPFVDDIEHVKRLHHQRRNISIDWITVDHVLFNSVRELW